MNCHPIIQIPSNLMSSEQSRECKIDIKRPGRGRWRAHHDCGMPRRVHIEINAKTCASRQLHEPRCQLASIAFEKPSQPWFLTNTSAFGVCFLNTLLAPVGADVEELLRRRLDDLSIY
jgi:hypothetical protein